MFLFEVWKPVPSAPLLEASSLGRVRSKPYTITMPNGGVKVCQMMPTYGVIGAASKGGYRRRQITFRRKGYRVARLVCEAFNGPPPSPRHEVLHRDENSLNNRAPNLRWGTRKENLNAPGFIAYCKSRTGDDSPRRKGQAAARKGRHRDIVGAPDF